MWADGVVDEVLPDDLLIEDVELLHPRARIVFKASGNGVVVRYAVPSRPKGHGCRVHRVSTYTTRSPAPGQPKALRQQSRRYTAASRRPDDGEAWPSRGLSPYATAWEARAFMMSFRYKSLTGKISALPSRPWHFPCTCTGSCSLRNTSTAIPPQNSGQPIPAGQFRRATVHSDKQRGPRQETLERMRKGP